MLWEKDPFEHETGTIADAKKKIKKGFAAHGMGAKV